MLSCKTNQVQAVYMYADGPTFFYLKNPVQNKDYRCLIGLINCKGVPGLIRLRASEHSFLCH